MGTGLLGRPLSAPFAPSAWFWVCSMQEEDPGLVCPPPLPQSLWLCFPSLTRLDPYTLPPPRGLGQLPLSPLLDPGRVGQGGQPERWGASQPHLF